MKLIDFLRDLVGLQPKKEAYKLPDVTVGQVWFVSRPTIYGPFQREALKDYPGVFVVDVVIDVRDGWVRYTSVLAELYLNNPEQVIKDGRRASRYDKISGFVSGREPLFGPDKEQLSQ